jgi:hypothetical protein
VKRKSLTRIVQFAFGEKRGVGAAISMGQ